MNAQKNDTKTKKIRKLMIDREIRGIDIIKGIGESKRMTYYVISGEKKNARIRKKIADYLNIPVESIFPSYKKDKAA